MRQVIDFGLTDYGTVYAEQKRLVEERLADRIPDTLLIGEHPHVITTGRGTQPQNLLNPTIPVVEIERGGDVTYHGPGQLIAYPILKMAEEERDLHKYLRRLEEVLILTLETFDITGFRREGLTGIWVTDSDGRDRKIASIGVAVKKWVTYHGIAFNVSTDLAYFRQINPCGLESGVMTSLEALTEEPFPMTSVKAAFVQAFPSV